MNLPRVLALSAVGLVFGACGGGGTELESSSGDDPAQEYTASTTVLESPEHGPQLCLGGVLTSYPPQCGGPDVIGWDWDAVDNEESANGVTWGEYSVVGTWDGSRLTLTEKPGAPMPPESAGEDESRFTTPCDPPSGGWTPTDPSKATYEGQEAALSYAREQPDFGGAWLDQQNPGRSANQNRAPDETDNDPKSLVLNLRFTANLEQHEAEVRRSWGGALCVSKAERPLSELLAIQQELGNELEGMTSSAVDEVHGVVEVSVIVADPDTQRRLDEKYGAGVVKLEGVLQPRS